MGRPKQSNTSRPTRGLIFGPATGETELSANGKRLRVEQLNLGRSGGFVVAESNDVERNGDLVQYGSEAPMAISLEKVAESSFGQRGASGTWSEVSTEYHGE